MMTLSLTKQSSNGVSDEGLLPQVKMKQTDYDDADNPNQNSFPTVNFKLIQMLVMFLNQSR